MLIRNKIFVNLIISFTVLMTSKNLFSNEINMLDPITVTGNLFPKKIKETGTSVTIIDKKEIKESGK